MSRADSLRLGLVASGVPASRADQIAGRLETIAKRRRRAKMKRIDRDRAAVSSARSQVKDLLEAFFPEAASAMAKQIVDARTGLGKMSDAEKEDLERQIEAILKELDFASWETLQSDVADILIAVTQDGIGVAFDQIGFSATKDIVDQVNAKAVEWARSRAAEMVGMRLEADGSLIVNPNAEWAITESTREMLRNSVRKAVEEGTSTSDLADELESEYAFSSARAEAIGRTEVAYADIEGNLIAYRDSGVVEGKEWIVGSEHDEMDECDDAADLGIVELSDDFNGLGDPPMHPNCTCLIGETMIAAAGVTAQTSRWFEGQISIISSAGDDLTVTPNHPILTPRGWVRAGDLKRGDFVYKARGPLTAESLADPDENYIVARIDEVPAALGVSGSTRIRGLPISTADFHGDGIIDGEVNVVFTARTLESRGSAGALENSQNLELRRRHLRRSSLPADRASTELPVRLPTTAHGQVHGLKSGFRAPAAFSGVDAPVANDVALADGSHGEPESLEMQGQRAGGAGRKPMEALARLACSVTHVEGADSIVGQSTDRSDARVAGRSGLAAVPNAEASLDEGATENFFRMTQLLGESLHRLASLVAEVEITDVRQEHFRGHVYNLATARGYYFAAAVVVHNCDVLPVLAEED